MTRKTIVALLFLSSFCSKQWKREGERLSLEERNKKRRARGAINQHRLVDVGDVVCDRGAECQRLCSRLWLDGSYSPFRENSHLIDVNFRTPLPAADAVARVGDGGDSGTRYTQLRVLVVRLFISKLRCLAVGVFYGTSEGLVRSEVCWLGSLRFATGSRRKGLNSSRFFFFKFRGSSSSEKKK